MTRVERRTFLTTLASLPVWVTLSGMIGRSEGYAATRPTVTRATVPKFRGVVYDVGLRFSGEGLSVEPFNPALVEHDMRVIKRELHATAVRIEGEVIQRLVTATRLAHQQGLSVFFNPWKMNADAAELRPYYVEAAKEAEKLRAEGVDIVFVAGCEYPIFQRGLLPGDTLAARLAGLGALFGGSPEEMKAKGRPLWRELNQILRTLVDGIRPEFKGRVTYAATSFEEVDWSMFDVVGVDHYRSTESAEAYVEKLNSYRVYNKPVVCMEVGCCTYVGAANLGGGGFMVLEGTNPDGSGRFKGGVVPTRSETEQADYVETQVELLSKAGADGVFVYAFSFPLYPTGVGARDLDLVSYAIVKTFPQGDPRSKAMPPWAPKESFHRLAGLYRQMAQPRG